jgi:acyl dehydratase/CBS domain-containing protein
MPLAIRVEDVMSSPVYTTEPDTTAADAATKCLELDVNSLVVTEGDEVVGIVTGTDLLEVLSAGDDGTGPVESVMSAPVVTIRPAASVSDAVDRMYDNEVARLVVLDGEELVGLVSTDDIVRYVPQVLHRRELWHEPLPESSQHDIQVEMAYENPDWEVECVGLSDDELNVGDRVEFSKTISEQDVRTFAAVSGDTNRLHLDDEYATETRFGRRISHGTLVSGLISAALARLPGLTIYLSQDLSFLAPVDIDERVTAVCEVTGRFGQEKYELTTDVFGEDGERVIEGEATVLIDASPAAGHAESESTA